MPKGGRRARLSLSQGTTALCLLCNKIRKSLRDTVPLCGSVQQLGVESKGGFYTPSNGGELSVEISPLRD